ncbi:hypothetical protein O9929_14975 [Vibrio lentus]|nr:hypothetical protein [Vibrio lentus]
MLPYFCWDVHYYSQLSHTCLPSNEDVVAERLTRVSSYSSKYTPLQVNGASRCKTTTPKLILIGWLSPNARSAAWLKTTDDGDGICAWYVTRSN